MCHPLLDRHLAYLPSDVKMIRALKHSTDTSMISRSTTRRVLMIPGRRCHDLHPRRCFLSRWPAIRRVRF